MAQDKQQKTSFLDLCEDVRRLIYAELLKSPMRLDLKIKDHSHDWGYDLTTRGSGLHPAILRTCKLVRDEALPILYSNKLRLPCPFSDHRYGMTFTQTFIDQVKEGSRRIQHMEYHIPGYFKPKHWSVRMNELEDELAADLRLMHNAMSLKTLGLVVRGYGLPCLKARNGRRLLDNGLKRLLPGSEIQLVLLYSLRNRTAIAEIDFRNRHEHAGWNVCLEKDEDSIIHDPQHW